MTNDRHRRHPMRQLRRMKGRLGRSLATSQSIPAELVIDDQSQAGRVVRRPVEVEVQPTTFFRSKYGSIGGSHRSTTV